MGFAQLMGRYRRLKQELAIAYDTRPWHSGRIDRLTDEMVEAERALSAMAQGEERSGESRWEFHADGRNHAQ